MTLDAASTGAYTQRSIFSYRSGKQRAHGCGHARKCGRKGFVLAQPPAMGQVGAQTTPQRPQRHFGPNGSATGQGEHAAEGYRGGFFGLHVQVLHFREKPFRFGGEVQRGHELERANQKAGASRDGDPPGLPRAEHGLV